MIHPVKTSHYMSDPQLLLGVLEQGDESPLASVSQLTAGYVDVQSFLPENSLPGGSYTPKPSSREGNLNSFVLVINSVIIWWFVIAIAWNSGLQSIAHRVRGISFIPRTSALWELPTCTGNIKPAVEARRPRRPSWRLRWGAEGHDPSDP